VSVLLHVCCGPCVVMPLEDLRERGFDVVGYFFNPNIHPYMEWKNRRDSAQDYAQRVGFELEVVPEYGLRRFLRSVVGREDDRCGFCYRWRLERTAQRARERGDEAFSSTLLVSPYQDREQLVAVGREAAAAQGLEFLEEDWRDCFREGLRRARELGLYMQKYCGCIYSEEERYLKKKPAKEQPRGGQG